MYQLTQTRLRLNSAINTVLLEEKHRSAEIQRFIHHLQTSPKSGAGVYGRMIRIGLHHLTDDSLLGRYGPDADPEPNGCDANVQLHALVVEAFENFCKGDAVGG